MYSKTSNNQPLHEGMNFKDLEGMMKPTIHVDEFSSKMGEDADIIVLSFYVRDKAAAKDLMSWLEKGYDWVLDADVSPGEIKPNRYLVYLEMRRRNAAPRQIQELLSDMSTLVEFDPDEWVMVYKGQSAPWSEQAFAQRVPLSPKDYTASTESGLNEMRTAAGLPTKKIHTVNPDVAALQSAAGIL